MLDVYTIMILLSANGLAVAVGLLWLQKGEARSAAFPWWAAGFLSGAAGILLLISRDDLPNIIVVDLVAIDLANLLTFLAFACWLCGTYRFNGQRLRIWALLPAAIWLAGLTIPVIRETFYLRAALHHGAAAVGYFLLCAAFSPDRSFLRRGRRPIVLVLLLAGLWSITACGAALVFEPASLDHSLVTLFGAAASILLVLLVALYGMRMIQERTERRLRDLALTDMLTGVLNRRGLTERLDPLLRQGDREGDRQAEGLALLACDLDHFKAVNDRHGHQAGDGVLTTFCRRAEGQLRPGDLFGRQGGEEFAAVVRVADAAQALAVAERIRAAVAATPFEVDGQSIPVTVSIGVAMLPPGDRDINAAMKAADGALYAAKAAGRDRALLAPGPAVGATAA